MATSTDMPINRCDIYLAGWSLYYFQGTFYPESGVISKSLLLILLLTSIYNCLYVVRKYSLSPYFKSLTALVVMFSLYGILLFMEQGREFVSAKGNIVHSKDYLQYIWMSLLPVYSFYRYTSEGYLTEKQMKVWVILFFAVATNCYFSFRRHILSDRLAQGVEQNETTNNIAYNFVFLVPSLMIFCRRRMIYYLGLAYCAVFIVLGMKRGAILVGIIVLLCSMISSIRVNKGRGKSVAIILSAVTITIIVFVSLYMLNYSNYFVSRVYETIDGNSSGRDEIYSYFVNHYINERRYGALLLGNGAYGTAFSLGILAHNDWLEIATNNGLIGIICFAIYWISFVYQWKTVRYQEAKIAIGLLLVFYFMRTLFSMSYNDMPFYSTCVLGYYLAKSDNLFLPLNNEPHTSDN